MKEQPRTPQATSSIFPQSRRPGVQCRCHSSPCRWPKDICAGELHRRIREFDFPEDERLGCSIHEVMSHASSSVEPSVESSAVEWSSKIPHNHP